MTLHYCGDKFCKQPWAWPGPHLVAVWLCLLSGTHSIPHSRLWVPVIYSWSGMCYYHICLQWVPPALECSHMNLRRGLMDSGSRVLTGCWLTGRLDEHRPHSYPHRDPDTCITQCPIRYQSDKNIAQKMKMCWERRIQGTGREDRCKIDAGILTGHIFSLYTLIILTFLGVKVNFCIVFLFCCWPKLLV